MKMKIALLLVILGGLILAIGMFLAIESLKPTNFKVLAGLVIAMGTIFALFGTQRQEQNSSKKTDTLLIEADSMRKQLGSLHQDLTQKDEKIIELSKRNIELGEKNSELSMRLSEKALDIYNLNKKIRYPLPESVELSLNMVFTLNDAEQKEAEKILTRPSQNSNAFVGINEAALMKLSEVIVIYLQIGFFKEYEISTSSFLSESQILILSTGFVSFFKNRDVLGKTSITYNWVTKQFLIMFEKAKLSRVNTKLDAGLNSNINANSIHDLENLHVILTGSILLHNPVNVISIHNLRIESKELNLNFWNLEKTVNKDVFVCTNKLTL